MEPVTLTNPAQLATPPAANAGAAANRATDSSGAQHPAFAQAMDRALTGKPTASDASHANSHAAADGPGRKARPTRPQPNAQHSQDSANDPTSTAPILIAPANVPQPVTLGQNMAPNLAAASTATLSSLDPANTTSAANIANITNNANTADNANAAAGLASSPASIGSRTPGPIFAAPTVGDPTSLADATTKAGAALSDQKSAPSVPAQAEPITANSLVAPTVAPTSPAAAQNPVAPADPGQQQNSTEAAATLASVVADTAPVIANNSPAPPRADGAVTSPKPDAKEGAVNAAPEKGVAAQGQAPMLATQIPLTVLPPAPALTDTANTSSSPQETATWKEVTSAVVATPPLTLAGPTTPPAKLGKPASDAQALPQTVGGLMDSQAPSVTPANFQNSAQYQSDARPSDTPGATKAVPLPTAGHESQQFSALVAANSPSAFASADPSTANIASSAALPERSATSAAPAPTPDAAAAPTHGPLIANPADFGGGKFISSAQLLAAVGHSEMRISVDTDKLGSIELRARLTGDQLGAAIMVEKREAHAILAAELPALQQALSDKQMRVDQISLMHGSFGATTSDAGASARQEQSRATPSQFGGHTGDTNLAGPRATANSTSGIFDSQGHLSVHA